MKKIPTIFKRDPKNMKNILKEINPECQWVFNGEGVATRKYDGTCVLIESDKKYYKRREIKKDKPFPQGFIPISFDPNTEKTVGWIEVDPNDKENKWHMEAFNSNLPMGTYELCGPKIQGNPEGLDCHCLIYHKTAEQYSNVPRTFNELAEWLKEKDIEGIVFHHPDGRMGKIKKKDFGFKRK